MKNSSKNILNKKNTARPQSSSSIHHLPNLTSRQAKLAQKIISSRKDKNQNPDQNEYDFKVNLNPKKDNESMYKNNMDLRQEIKDLNKKIDFLKSNNQKLSQIITQKNKEINELTNQIIIKNRELLTKEKKEKEKNDKNKNINKSEKEKEISKNKNIIKTNVFEKELQLKKFYIEISRIKEEYNKLILELRAKDEEILDLKRNKKLTDYNELKIKNEILSQEFNKLKEMYLLSLDMNKKNEDFGKNENILKAEIQTQHNIIVQLNQEIDGFSLERKKLNDEIKSLRNKLELSMNNNKFIKNKKDSFEKKYKRNIKEQVLQKEYEEEKQEMLTKINKLQKNLDHYRLIAMKNKDFGAFTNKNKDEIKNNTNSNANNNNLGQNVIKNRIIAKVAHNPEENYDNKTLLMQSIITELTNEKKELLEKLKLYENQNNNNNNFNNKLQNNSIPQSKNNTVKANNLLQTTEEILIADNNPNQNNMSNEVQNDLNIDNKKIEESKENENNNKEEENNDDNKEEENNDNNKIEEVNNDNNKIEEANSINDHLEDNQIGNENIEKEEIKFDDIFEINLEYKNINSSNIKNLFSHIFSKYRNENKNLESNKESLLTLLTNEISLKLNCQAEEEKKNIYENIETFCNQEEDFEEVFYMIFDDIINHNEESTKINDSENDKILNSILKKNQNAIEDIVRDNMNKIRIDNLYDILFENNIKIEKKLFLYLCYKLKTDDCSLYEIEIKEILKFIK